ncbi:AAA family ATPase [Kurthia gibsonii]|uniref:AAA family ATPase n=1 Tax=Kurthia gibsonii TaxID=33946 RepID=UPI0013EF18C1|nr:ATP-binding protein [Kurthia gibsonii]
MIYSYLYPFTEDVSKELPNYAEYASFFKRITHILNERIETTWRPLKLVLNNSQFDQHIIELMHKDLLKFEVLTYLYEAEPTYNLEPLSWLQQDDALHEFITFDNKLIYYPDYEVAIAPATLFCEDSWREEEICYFAPSSKHMKKFIDGVNKQLRNVLMSQVSYLVDTDDGLRRSNLGEYGDISRKDVFLDEQLKRNIFRSIDEFFKDDGQFYKHYNIPYKRGILLYGSPGNGKTTLVKSITGSVDAPVVYWQITEHTDSESIQEVFRLVSSLSPAILVIEDIESMPEYARSVFLNALDGAQSRHGVFVIGTTNYPERIDPALINRAGRFDRAYEIKNPNKEMRLHYLQKLDQQHIFTEEQLEHAAKLSKKLSMSQLNEFYISVALNWHYDQELNYEEVITDLQKQRKNTERNEWEEDEHTIGF